MSVGAAGARACADSSAGVVASRTGDCAALVGLFEAEGCIGKDIEKRLCLVANGAISVAAEGVDIVFE